MWSSGARYGFDGFVISDCGAFSLICSPNCYTYNVGHNYTVTYNQTVGVAAPGGMDAACDAAFGPSILPAFLNGTVTLPQLTTAATRYLSQVLYAGVLDPPSMNPYSAYGPERIDTAASRTLAFEAAVQSIVLLKNDGGLLPLASSKSLRRLAVQCTQS